MPSKVVADTVSQLLVGSNFFLEIDNVAISSLSEISGLAIEIDTVEKATAGADGKMVVKKRPSVVKYGNVTVKRPFTGDKALYEWQKLIRDGKEKELRRSGAFVLYDLSNTELSRWSFLNVWVSKWSLSDLDVGSDDPVMEEAVIAVEELKREK